MAAKPHNLWPVVNDPQNIEQLAPAEQADIAAAISAVRRTRQVTSPGMPAIRGHPDPSVGPEEL